MTPKNWKKLPLMEVAKFLSGGTPSKEVHSYWNGSIPWFTAKDLKTLILDESLEKVTELGAQNGTRVVDGGTILVLVRGMGLLKDIPIGICTKRSTFNQDIKAIIPNKIVDPIFLCYSMEAGKRDLHSHVSIAGHGTGRLELQVLLDHPILLPPLDEQRVIVSWVNKWEDALAKTERLISCKEKRRRGLLQKLLTGQAKLPGYEIPWRSIKIKNLLREVKRPVQWNEDTEYKLLSIRRRSGGVFHRETLLGSQILTKKLFVVRPGDFLISRRQIIHGATGVVTEPFDGFFISDSYLDYVSRDNNLLDIAFFGWLSKTPEMYRKALIASHGVHREKMMFDEDVYLRESVRIPPTIEEQRSIVAVLEAADREIQNLVAYRDALKIQKKGLMQQLLTGKKRVT